MRIPLESIREAAARTAPHLLRTPVLSSRSLGERAGVRLDLKCELFQKTGSFKPRGALNLVLALPPEQRSQGRHGKLRGPEEDDPHHSGGAVSATTSLR